MPTIKVQGGFINHKYRAMLFYKNLRRRYQIVDGDEKTKFG